MTLSSHGRRDDDAASGFAPTVQGTARDGHAPVGPSRERPPRAVIESTSPGAPSVPDVVTDLSSDLGGDVSAIEGTEPFDAAGTPTLSHIGRYALKRKLAQGGLGSVYEAWDPLLSRLIAIKTLQFDLEMPERVPLDGLFLNEARMAASLSHRYIVTIHDAGLSAHGVYIAMERLVGQDLREMLDAGWSPTPAQAALLARRVADALAYAHGRGVVHCDIKPANIFMQRRQRPKVLDFGIARAAGATSVLEGLVAGSPHYLAPEQLQGGEVTPRTDVYALGVVLYELLTGRKAFDGDSLTAISAAVLAGSPVPPHELRPEVPGELSRLVLRAMAPAAADRLASAAEFSGLLRAWLEAQPHAAGASAARSKPPADPPRARPTGVTAWLLGAAAVCAVAAIAWRAAGPDATSAQAAPTPAKATTLSAAPAPAEGPGPTVPPGPEPAPTGGADPGRGADAATAVAAAEPARREPQARPRGPRVAPPPTAAPAAATPAPVVQGEVLVAVSPWGQVEVDGVVVGTAPPMARLTLPTGRHTITLRNGDAAPHTVQVQVSAEQPVVVRHRFGP